MHNFSDNHKQRNKFVQKRWLSINPPQVNLQGILLTSTFNLQNVHQHLAVKYLIKSFVNNKQVPFLQIFPQKGTIMRGQIKKIRMKFLKDYNKILLENDNIYIKIYMNLNTSYNKQYLQMSKFSGWNQISQLPIQQYIVPVKVSSDYKQIKNIIRQQVKFQSQFGKISQQMSSLYGQQKFQIPESILKSKNNLVLTKEHKLCSQMKSFQNKSYKGGSEKKYKPNINKQKVVYFGMQPNYEEQNIKYHSPLQIKTSHQNNRSRSLNHQKQNMDNQKKNKQKNMKRTKNYQINDSSLQNINKNNKIQNKQDSFQLYSSVKKLKEVESKSQISDQYLIKNQLKENSNMDQNNFATIQSIQLKSRNNRSIQLIFLAIFAGFFVALGANVKKFFY